MLFFFISQSAKTSQQRCAVAAWKSGNLASCPSWPRPRIPAFQVSGLHPARRGGGGAAAAPRLGTHTPL